MTFLVLLYGGIDFYRKKVYFDQLFLQLEQLDKPYLIGEVMEKSPLLTDRLYRRVLHISNPFSHRNRSRAGAGEAGLSGVYRKLDT